MSDNLKRCQIFMIEERSSLARCYSEFLSKEDADIHILESSEKAIAYFSSSHDPVLILLDLQLHDFDGIKLLELILEKSPRSAVVVITSNGSFEISRQVMNLGAVDYLEKPFTRDRLCVTMRNAKKQLELEKATNTFGDQFCGFVGSSIVMQGVYRIIQSAATSSKASVFITGESGTGKEVCSQAIHDLSDRSANNCVILNCAAIPKDLIESEIFGHVKGAFTGAVSNRDGAATRAHKGTLFLDEIGEMDLELQSKLLRFIQTGKFSKVGSSVEESVDVRFICATNRDPLIEIENNRFREDLYYRLNVIPINLPPLRERSEDIVRIAEHYLKIFSQEESKAFEKLSDETKAIFLNYNWPGNVRQLLNVVRNIVVLNNASVVTPEMLPSPFNRHVDSSQQAQLHTHSVSPASSAVNNITDINSRHPSSGDTYVGNELYSNNNAKLTRGAIPSSEPELDPETDIDPLWKVEMDAIDRAVKICKGNITLAAKYLEINPSTIHRKKQAWIKNGQM